MKILFIATGLNMGGAEKVLVDLANHLEIVGHEVIIMTLVKLVPQSNHKNLLNKNIRVLELDIEGSIISVFKILKRIKTEMKAFQPEVVQGWLYHGNLFSLLAKLFLGKSTRLFWSIHHSVLSTDSLKLSTYLIGKMLGYLSYCMNVKTVFCSKRAMENHIICGCKRSKCVYIPNGFDSKVFFPNKEGSDELKFQFHIKEKDFVIGKIARFHPDKDHENFIKAASIFIVKNEYPVKFLLCGPGISSENEELVFLLDKYKVRDYFILIPGFSPISRIMNLLDMVCLSSRCEAFPMVLGEAMLCGVPCISTDVGDAKEIVSERGLIVPIRDADSLADAFKVLDEQLKEDSESVKKDARNHIIRNFSQERFFSNFENLYKDESS